VLVSDESKVPNDSDLLAPIQVVTGQLNKPVGMLNPQKHPCRALLPHFKFIKQIRSGGSTDRMFSG
jgi:hypothetical protein